MNGKTAKRLRAEAQHLTIGEKEVLYEVKRHPMKGSGGFDDLTNKPFYANTSQRVLYRYSTRKAYKMLKKAYKEGLPV